MNQVFFRFWGFLGDAELNSSIMRFLEMLALFGLKCVRSVAYPPANKPILHPSAYLPALKDKAVIWAIETGINARSFLNMKASSPSLSYSHPGIAALSNYPASKDCW